MSNKAKQAAAGSAASSRERRGKDRRAKVEEMRQKQQAAERRRSILYIGVACLIGLGLIGAVTVPALLRWLDDPRRAPVTAFGVSAAAAQCDPIQNDPPTGASDHVGPGSPKPETTRVKYATVPPSSGQHFAVPAPFQRKFYTAQDRPQMETLVHNLEHGYTVVWYDDTVRGQELDALKSMSENLGNAGDTGKFIVSPWDPSYGALPEGKHIGVSAWGHRQLCGKVSGEAVHAFAKQFPPSQAPEPNAP